MAERLTASRMDRAYGCPASFALPGVSLPSGDDASRGEAIHQFLETAVKRGKEAALSEIADDNPWRAICENIDVDSIVCGAEKLECEITLAYNPLIDAARTIGKRLSRNYEGLAESEIAGTADLIITYPNGSVAVIDYKTGYRYVSPAKSGQLELLGLAAAREKGLSEIFVSIIQIDENGNLKYVERLLTSADLDRIAIKVRAIFEKIIEARDKVLKGQIPDVQVGEHCEYCPAYRVCPANVSLAGALIFPERTAKSPIDEMSPEEAGIVWERVMHARRVLDEIEEGLRAYIDRSPIPLPGGEKEVACVESVRETIIGRAAVPVLFEHLGDTADEIIEPSVTKKAIETLVKKLSSSGQEARFAFNDVLTSLRQVGAIRETAIINYRVRPTNNRRSLDNQRF